MVVQFIATVVLARILTPTEIGLYSVSIGFVAMAHSLRDFGVSSYLVQERELTAEKIRSAYGVTLLVAWALAGVLAAAAGPISWFYDEPGVRSVLLVLSLNFLLIPLSSVALALLKRNMDFGALYRIGFAAAVIEAGTSITLAWHGFAYMSLAWASVAGSAATIVMAALASVPNPWIPSFRESRQVAVFGSRLSVASLAIEAGNAAPEMILGKVLGFYATGIHTRALGYVNLAAHALTQALQPVALAHFAAQRRSEEDSVSGYLQGTEFLLSVLWPAMAFLGLLAGPLVSLLYGDQWGQSVPLAQVLCGMLAVKGCHQLAGPLMVAHGGARQVMRAQLAIQATKIVMVAAVASAGLMYVAVALVIAEVLALAITTGYLRQLVPVPVWGLGARALRPLALTLACALAFAALQRVLPGGRLSAAGTVALAAAVFSVTWVAAAYLLRTPVAAEISRAVESTLGARRFRGAKR